MSDNTLRLNNVCEQINIESVADKENVAAATSTAVKAEWPAMPQLPVAWGEVFDKLTILQIKAENKGVRPL